MQLSNLAIAPRALSSPCSKKPWVRLRHPISPERNWRRLSSTPPSPGKKGGLAVGPAKRGKGTEIIVPADDHILPVAVSIESASPHESQLVEGVLGHSFVDTLPARLIGDKAYDSDRLDRDVADRYGIEMISPHRGQRRALTQDGRPLRRYRRR